MHLFEMLEFLKISDIVKDAFTVNILGTDKKFYCLFYGKKWVIIDSYDYLIEFVCVSRCDCLECLNYFYGLPF